MTIEEILDGVEVLTPIVVGRIFTSQSEGAIQQFIDTHKKGWNGRLGQHARVLAQLMITLRTYRPIP